MSENAPGGFTAGSRIAGYLLEEQIGQGGMAVVFRAVDERLDRLVALKILAPALASDEAFRQRFIRESRAAAAVDNPHIIPVFEAGEASGVLFIAMRYVRGGDLRSLVTRLGPLPPSRVAEMISQTSSALDAAHERGLVHRDVKPANMLLDASGGANDHVYLSDFGLTKTALAASGITGTGQFIGTLDYIAPEQILGRPVDGRTDQYALACAAFELLTGKPPFSRDTAIAIMYAQLSGEPPTPTSRRPDLPPAVDDVFAKALAKDPEDRYATCREFAEAMREALGIRPFDSGQRTAVRADRPARKASPAPPAADLADATSADSGTDSRADTDRPTIEVTSRDLRQTRPRLADQGREPADQAPEPADQAPEPAIPPAEAGRRRSPVVLIGAVAGVLVLAGAAAAYVMRGGTTISTALPGCTAAVASAKTLSVPAHVTNIPSGNPFGLQVSASGKYVFVSTPTGVSVLVRGAGTSVSKHYDYTLTNDASQRPKGMALTADGRFLLVAIGNGIDVMKVASLEQDAAAPAAGTLTVPGITGYGGAVGLALSPDNHYVFLTLQYANEMAVFNLQQAEGGGFSAQSSAGSYVGAVTLHLRPIGITASPGGQWLYVTSLAKSHLATPAQGLINVLDLAKAEKDPTSSVISWTEAGCNPGRAVTSPDGKIVWVTARNGDDVLAFSADRLRTDPAHAFVASVLVGKTPVGEIMVNGGTRLIVANTDIAHTSAKSDNLAVVDVRAALAGKPALLGYISSGQMPREFAVVPGGKYLLVADNNSAQIQWIDLTKLP